MTLVTHAKIRRPCKTGEAESTCKYTQVLSACCLRWSSVSELSHEGQGLRRDDRPLIVLDHDQCDGEVTGDSDNRRRVHTLEPRTLVLLFVPGVLVAREL